MTELPSRNQLRSWKISISNSTTAFDDGDRRSLWLHASRPRSDHPYFQPSGSVWRDNSEIQHFRIRQLTVFESLYDHRSRYFAVTFQRQIFEIHFILRDDRDFVYFIRYQKQKAAKNESPTAFIFTNIQFSIINLQFWLVRVRSCR